MQNPHPQGQPPLPEYYGMTPPPPPPGIPGPRPHMPSRVGQARARTGLWRTLGILVFVAVIGFNILLFLGMFGAVGMMGGGGDPRGVVETGRESGGSHKVAVIPIDGIILEGGGGGLFGGGIDPVALVQDGLKRAAKDDNVAAVILEVNSPGGGVTASDFIHNAIVKFRKNSGKPVVVYMKDLAASGGYYVSAPADYIVASPTTLTGSIGVIIQGINLHGTLTELIKGQDATVKAGGNKAMGSMFADPQSQEYKEGQALLQELADEMHTRFKGIVRDGRRNLADDWESYADGRVMTANKAKEIGLVDEVGYFEAAKLKAEALSGHQNMQVVEYGRQMGLAALFGVEANNSERALEMAERAAPAIAAAGLSARLQEVLRLYPGQPMAIWVP